MTITGLKTESTGAKTEPRDSMTIKQKPVDVDAQQEGVTKQLERQPHQLQLKAIPAAVRKLRSPAIASPVFARPGEWPFRFLDLPAVERPRLQDHPQKAGPTLQPNPPQTRAQARNSSVPQTPSPSPSPPTAQLHRFKPSLPPDPPRVPTLVYAPPANSLGPPRPE